MGAAEGALGYTVAQWSRQHATSQKVAGSRPNEVNEFLFQFI
jgi:hypothetical protein